MDREVGKINQLVRHPSCCYTLAVTWVLTASRGLLVLHLSFSRCKYVSRGRASGIGDVGGGGGGARHAVDYLVA